MKYISCNREIVLVLLNIFISSLLLAQSPYRIEMPVSSSKAHITGFLKMGTNISLFGNSLSYNESYLIRNGKPWFPVMGEFHFSRVPVQHWEEELLKMKSCGIQIISTYVMWNFIENTEGTFNWTGNNDLRKFLSICDKLHLYVWLRPGPWVHAEVRNGGLPDWVVHSQVSSRTIDTVFLRYVDDYFRQIALECSGFWFKQDGPVIGVQIENELVFKKEPAYAYMKVLKEIAVRAGIDVPYYSAFAQGPDTQNEFLYTIGSYPDSPWNLGTQKLIKPVFFIRPLEADRDIGSDLFGMVDGKVRNTYPKLGAEIGGGMQKTYHRRTKIYADDIVSNVLTKLAGGLNGVGYYMFHGGVNPVCATTMQESRQTNYPNDLPLINYDFQAPLGAMGNMNKTYKNLKLLNLFLDDFGGSLVQMTASFPAVRKESPLSIDTVQCSLRTNNGHGFIFLNNYQRYVHQPEVKNFQLKIINRDHEEPIPAKPVTFKADSYAIWPYHLLIGDILIDYATAQPLCCIRQKDELDYFFVSNGQTEFCMEANTTAYCKPLRNCSLNKFGLKNFVHCPSGETAVFDMTATTGQHVRCIVLPKEEALNAYKVNVNGKEVLVITEGFVYYNDGKVHIQNTGSKHKNNSLTVYPDLPLKPLQNEITLRKVKAAFPFTQYKIEVIRNQSEKVIVKEDQTTLNPDAFFYKDSVLKEYMKSKYFKLSQRGPLYQYHFHDLPEQKKYMIQYNLPTDNVVKSWQMQFDYLGDIMAIYDSGKLVYDQFNYDGRCVFSPDYLLNKNGGNLLLQLLPGYKGMDIFWEKSMKLGRKPYPAKAILKSVSLIPLYDFEFENK